MKLSTVEITEKNISEMDNKRLILSISREKITQISLRFGIPAEKPLRECLFYLLLLFVGLVVGVLPMLAYFINPNSPGYWLPYYVGKTAHPIFIFTITAAFFPFGIYLLFQSFKKKYYLEIFTGNDKRKIVFRDSITHENVLEFIDKIQRTYGYKILI